jgi:uncharacterized protein YkwD
MTWRALFAAIATAAVPLSPTEHAFLHAINDTRAEHGIPQVSIDATLVRAARFHSADMVQRGYFAHDLFSRRLQSFGVGIGVVGEDLGWDSHLEIAVPELIELWLESPKHRRVLLDPRYRLVGLGVVKGPFRGYRQAIVVTADFYGP